MKREWNGVKVINEDILPHYMRNKIWVLFKSHSVLMVLVMVLVVVMMMMMIMMIIMKYAMILVFI